MSDHILKRSLSLGTTLALKDDPYLWRRGITKVRQRIQLGKHFSNKTSNSYVMYSIILSQYRNQVLVVRKRTSGLVINIMEVLEGTSFEFWLKKLCDSFFALTDPQKNKTIDNLIRICGPEQLRFLSTKLEILIKRDFLKSLPLELSFHVLKWLDPASLCRCCLVSKNWNKVISSCSEVWQEACCRLGMKVDEEADERLNAQTTWKDVYVDVEKRIKILRDQDSVEIKYFYGHTARVFALCYRDNYLVTGSDDRSVCLWDVSTGHPKYTLTTHTCADVSFDNEKVVTASFDNTIGRWDWKTGDNLQFYQGHTGAVFCVDYNDQLDMIVSGSADTSVKLWRMSSAECLATRRGHTDWVTKVILKKVAIDSMTHKKGEYSVLSMDKWAIKVWSVDPAEKTCRATLTPSDPQTNLQPRLQFDGHTVVCASDSGILIWSFETLQALRVFASSPAKWLVAYGRMFSVFLDTTDLHIVNTQTEECIAKVCLPPFRKSVRGSNFTPGDTSWLEGFHSGIRDRLLFATSMPDHSVLVLKVKDVT